MSIAANQIRITHLFIVSTLSRKGFPVFLFFAYLITFAAGAKKSETLEIFCR
jgi:hypothetical protein